MNSQGYTKDNIHKGNTKIVAGGIDVDGLVRVGDQSVGGDGYVLPAVKGTEGQVLTMNADNTSSFQDAGGTGSARVIQNLLEMTEPYNSQYITNGSGRVMYEQATGSDIITTANLNVGDVVRFYACGYFWSNNGATLTSRFRLTIGVPNTDTSIDSYQSVGVSGSGMNTSDPQRGGRFSWWIMCNVSKIDESNNCNITIHGQYAQPGFNDMLFTFDTTGVANATRSNCRPKTESSLSGYYSTLPTTFQIRLDWLNDAGLPNDLRAVATTYRIDLMNTTEVLATTISPTTDHNSLANLNVGDPHQLYAYLGGRSGGQVLSGGITPANFLTLKSHTAGANNIVVKDLNTTFEKDIDLDNNSLLNGLGVNTQFLLATSQTETPLIVGSGGGALAITSNDLTLTENNLPSGEYMNFNNTRALTYKTLDMNTNDITNANVIVRASNGNVINFDNDIAPPLITGALTIESGAGKEVNINADNVLKLNGNSIIHNSGTGPHQFNDTGGLQAQFTSANIELFKNLDMKNNNIDNVNQVSSSGTLTLLGALGNRCDIGVAGATRLEVEDGRVLISQFADFNIQDQIIYVQSGTMPTLFQDGKTYIFVGSRTTNTPIVLNNINVTFKGTSRDTSSIEYTGVGSFITATDCNLSISDLELKCNVAGSLLLTASNPSKLKVLSISNCEVIDSYEFSDISGHELVDINNCLFIHLRGDGVLTNQKCLYINGVAKTNITSCEIVKFFEIGQPANTNPFDGAMIYITGACGAVSIIGGIIHPRVNQRAVEIDNTATFLEFALNTNNFIDIGLTTGAILQTNSNASWDTNATSEANSLLPNLKSFVGAQLSAQNTNDTATVLNTPVDINLGTLLTSFAGFGVTVGTSGGVTYNRKRPVNFQVTFVANLQAITGGAGQRIALSTSKNGVNTGIKSFVTLDSAGTEPKQCTLTLIGTAVQGDVFRSQLINETTTSNIRCLDLLVSGIEI